VAHHHRGDGRGRLLGWPTANLRSAAELLPAMGVYAVRARLHESGPGEPPRLGPPIAGAANLGVNPTFRAAGGAAAGGKTPLLLEVHLLDFSADLYGRTLRVEFVQRLREERRFPGADALKAQISADVELARRVLAAVQAG
jgi:riboflavin kinase/FMN adenylyltransferase